MPQTLHDLEAKYYLADLLDAPVLDSGGGPIGQIADLAMHLGEKFPRVPGLIIRDSTGESRWLARRDQFQEFAPGRFRLKVGVEELLSGSDLPDQVLMRSIWDKQIVDISDARVVRVNDIQLAQVKGELRLIGVDIGMRGLIRRLGWEGWLCPLLERLKIPVRQDIIGWDHVESIPTNFRHLKLSVPSQKIWDLHPADLADILDDLSVQEGLNLIHSLDDETAAETLAEAEAETQAQIIAQLPSERASDILEEMEPDEAVDILQDLDDTKAAEILSHMESDEASDVRELLKHDESTAGGLMSTGYATIYEEFTVDDALKHLRLIALDLEIIYYLYVLDNQDRLKGVVSIRNLLIGAPTTKVTDLICDKLITVPPDSPQEEVASLISKYNLLALPVVDENEHMLGVVTIDDVMELLLDHMPRMWKRRALSS